MEKEFTAAMAAAHDPMPQLPSEVWARIDDFLAHPETGTIRKRPVLDTTEVGKLIGVQGATVTRYLYESRGPGRRYSQHPFPEPAGTVGQRPYWKRRQAADIVTWADSRPGSGKGGGRPRGNT